MDRIAGHHLDGLKREEERLGDAGIPQIQLDGMGFNAGAIRDVRIKPGLGEGRLQGVCQFGLIGRESLTFAHVSRTKP